jgi:hypothetical protein
MILIFDITTLVDVDSEFLCISKTFLHRVCIHKIHINVYYVIDAAQIYCVPPFREEKP